MTDIRRPGPRNGLPPGRQHKVWLADIETAHESAAHVHGCGCLPGPCAWCGLDEASYYARMAKR